MSENFYYKKDRLNQLRGFCTTVQTGSIIKTAKIMHIEPTTVSKLLKSLERDLNLTLFDRETRKQRLTITEMGKKFYKVAVSALQNMESVFEFFENENEEENRKEIKIASHHTISYYLIPQYVKRFLELHPDATFLLKNLSLPDSLNDLRNDDVDLVLYPVETQYDEFNLCQLYDLNPTILVNKYNELAKIEDKEITFRDLAKQNVMLIDDSKILPFFKQTCEQYNIKSNIKFTNTDWEMIRSFVKMDLGVHLYTELYNKFDIFKNPDIVSKNVSHLFPNVKVNVITKKSKLFPIYVNNFLDILKSEFKI